MWLAWRACGGPLGMGFLQDRPEATKDEVWAAAQGAYDYGGCGFKQGAMGVANTDYVFGRMMKLCFEYGQDWVEVSEATPRLDYQAWCDAYPTYEALVRAAITVIEA